MKTYLIQPKLKRKIAFKIITDATYKWHILAAGQREKTKAAQYARNMVNALSEKYVEYWRAGLLAGTLDLDPRMSDSYRAFLKRIGTNPDGPELVVRGQIVDGVVAHPVMRKGSSFTARIGVATNAMFIPLSDSKKVRKPMPLGDILTIHELGSADGIVPPRPSFRNAMNQWTAAGGPVRKLAMRFLRP